MDEDMTSTLCLCLLDWCFFTSNFCVGTLLLLKNSNLVFGNC